MRKRAERTLRELYDLTGRISEPEITPVLEGSCRIQGPVDESDHELRRTNSGIFPAEKKFTFVNESLRTRTESGTCNVCSAPCSSCMHFNRTVLAMESKIESGFSRNTCGSKEADSCSFIGVNGMPLYKSRICDDSQHAASETSNLLSASSSHDSYSENAESKATLRASVTYDASEGVDMPPMLPSGETVEEDQLIPKKRNVTADGLFSSNSDTTADLCHRTSSSQDEEQRGLECHGDNISFITGVRDSNITVGDRNVDLGKKDAACSSASTSSLLAKGIENAVQVEATDCFHGSENEESQNNCRRPRTCPKESLRKKSSGSANAAFSDKSDLAEFPLPKNNPSQKVQSPRSHSQSGHLSCHNGDFKDSEAKSSSQLCVDGESSLGPPPAAASVDEKKPTTLTNNENSSASHIRGGFSSGAVKITDPCVETENGMDSRISSDEVMKSSTINKEFEMPSSLMEASDMQGPQVPPQPITEAITVGGNSESDTELDDVKVCDICGDAGREELLAICSRCSDGAEHTYCMREMLNKVPESDWLCEECQLKEDTENKVDRSETISEISKECKIKEDSEIKKVDRTKSVSGTSKECKLKEDIDNKMLDKSEMVSKECKLKEDPEIKKVDRTKSVSGTSKECKLKEDTENKMVDKSEMVSGTSKLTCLNETSQNFVSTSNSKLLSKLDTKAIDPDVRGAPKGLQSPQISGRRHADSQEVISMNSKKASETSGGSTETGSPRKRTALLRESSFKNLDTGKARLANMPPSWGGQSANSSQAFPRSQSLLGSNSSKVQAQVQPPCGPLSRSISFNNLNTKPKVKQLTENVPVKPKMTRESASSDARKEALVRSMTKSKSFKSVSSGRSNTDSASKTQFIHQSRVEDPRGLKQVKERNVSEKKNSSIPDCPLVISSPRAGTSIPLPNVDTKVAQRDGKLNNTSRSNVLSINKGSDDANDLGGNEPKKQSTYSSKSFNAKCNTEDQRPCQTPKEGARGSSSASDKSYNNAETVIQRGVPQSSESTHRDDKTKDPSIFSSSKQLVSGGNRILHCQRCNETGHATQFCSIDKLRLSALKPSAERNSRDANKKGSKWKDAVEATISKCRIQKNNRQPDQSDEFSVPSADLSSEVASKDFLPSSSNFPRNMPLVEGTTDEQAILRSSDADPSKTALVIDLGPQAVQPVEGSCTPRAGDLNAAIAVSDELNAKPLTHILLDETSTLANPFRASVIPELEFIWQGSLEVLTTGRDPELFDGIQAHLSTCASPKVLEVATKFPCRVQLEEVSSISSWPSQSQGISPKEENIALFFFARDVESYERSYSKILENMLKNDLALRGNIDGVELLILTSNKLPVNSQRWNMLFFLWGVFRGRGSDCLKSISGAQKKPSGPILNIEPLIQDLPSALKSVVPPSQKTVSVENPENKSPRCEGSPKAKALKFTTCVDAWPISSSTIEGRTSNTQASPLVCNSSYQSAADNRVPLEHGSCSFPVSCPSGSMSQLSNLLDTYPESRFQMSTTHSCPEVKSDDSYLKNFVSDSEGRHIADPSALVPANSEQLSRSRASPSYSISSDCRQGTGMESSRSETKLREKEISVKSAATFYDDPQGNPSEMDHLSWETRPNRKRAHSCSLEAGSQASGETSKSTGVTMPWKDKANHLPVGDEREWKKMCYSEEHAGSSFGEETLSAMLSSKVHPLLASFLSDQHRESRDGVCDETVLPDNSRSTERFFFPVEPSPVRNTKSDNLIHILSSDDEETPESNTPNLELALGGKKNRPKPEVLPLLFQSVDRKGSQERSLVPVADDEDDVSASLSLSLAIPSSQEERKNRPILKSEQLLPEMPRVNTSLLLFGGFSDT